MEETVNIPIQMISVCSTMGEFTPMRFRFEDENHEIETVKIEQILSHKETGFNGIREIRYTCQAVIGCESRMFIICYSVVSHKWKLLKMLM